MRWPTLLAGHKMRWPALLELGGFGARDRFRFGLRWRFRIRLGFLRRRVSRRARVFVGRLIQPHFAFATIAAASALFANVVVAGVLGAALADTCGFRVANAASEGHGGYFFFPEDGAAEG